MLNPNENRLDYGQILTAPEGYKPDFAVGTTYSLDLDALTGVAIALGLSEETDSNLMKNPVCLLEALRAVGDKVAFFCEGGCIHLPKNVTSLYILLEKMVFQVNTPKRKGTAGYPVFHPKFWLLRYVDKNDKALYRVIVLSRNLTFDRSWDVSFCMDGVVNLSKTSKKTAPIIDFLSYLAGHLTGEENAKMKREKISSLQKELPYVDFKLDFNLDTNKFEDFFFLPVGINNNDKGELHTIQDEPFNPLFRDTFDGLLIMSPFLTNSVIKGFNDRKDNIKHTDCTGCILITTAMSLQSLKKSDCSNFKIFTMRDEVVYGESEIAEDGSQMQKQDIHAKLYMVSKDSDSYLYLGSLNASHNATSGNVEFMVMLKSKTDYLNLQSLKESILGGKDSPELFKEVTLDDNRKEETETDNILDSYIKAVNRMEPSAVIKQNGEKHDVNITFKNYEKYIENDNYTVYISPLLVDKKEHISESVSFTALNLTQLSKFYRVSVSDGKTTVERVLVIPTEGLPKEREGAVAASIVNNRESFFQYVAFLLGDSPVTSALEYANNSNSFGGNKNENKTFMPALYEKMLKTAATNPEHFKEIDFLINSISDDGVIPEDFKNLYNIFKKVVKIRG